MHLSHSVRSFPNKQQLLPNIAAPGQFNRYAAWLLWRNVWNCIRYSDAVHTSCSPTNTKLNKIQIWALMGLLTVFPVPHNRAAHFLPPHRCHFRNSTLSPTYHCQKEERTQPGKLHNSERFVPSSNKCISPHYTACFTLFLLLLVFLIFFIFSRMKS